MKKLLNLPGVQILNKATQQDIKGGKGLTTYKCAVSKKCFTASDCISFSPRCVMECFAAPNGEEGICVGYVA
ncbi:hypothetical protein [Tenacibaculum jejuense]|uniref:hypothetical protein n=1 Tax=Tenacibaculum jejuense TaxID=584609 RepID=UPI000BA36542|nr:hypothetical protein [Tenacibaculum jejuense]